MFGFLKDKLKSALKKFSSGAKEEVEERPVDAPKAEPAKPAPKPEKAKAEPKREEKPAPKRETPKAKKREAPTKDREAPKREPEKAPEREAPKEPPATATPRMPPPERLPQPSAEEVVHRPSAQLEPVKPELEREVPERERFEEVMREPLPEKPVEPAAPDAAREAKPGFLRKLFKREEPKPAPKPVEPKVAVEPKTVPKPAEQPESEGFFAKVGEAFTKKTLSPEKFDELFWELELAMLENNVAVEVIEKIKLDLREELTTGKVSRFSVEEMIAKRLRQSVEELFEVEGFDLIERAKSKKPFKICVIGVNGSGKTTTLAKIVKLFQDNGLSCVVAASDTFRAAAIDQLQQHTDRLGVKLISQGYGADPAAVAFDAIKHAEAKGIDVVLIDTAGRLHSNTNLMAELEKVVRVAKPDLKLFVGESITGNDCIEQAKVFDSLVGIDGIILTKADVDEKGGAAISVSYVTKKPILYLGTGQKLEDLEPFEKRKVVEAVGL